MLGYYSLSRRRSSQNNNNNNPPSPSLPLNSSSIHESDHLRSPTSPTSLKIPSSPPAERQLASDSLGSPFSITNPIYPFQPDQSSRSKHSLPALSEGDHDHGDTDMNLMNSGGSRAPLLARDFGMSGSSKRVTGTDHAGDEGVTTTSDSFSLLPGDDTSLPKSSIDLSSHKERERDVIHDPNLIPPVSIHDKYVSKHIQPLTSPSTLEARPSMTRSTSAPGHPHHSHSQSATSPPTDSKGLLPSAIPSEDSTTNAAGGQQGNQPIYEIFNANLSKDGMEMSKNLRGYLEVVLKGQEQLSKMHLQLEGSGMGANGIWQVDKDDNVDGDGKKDEKEVKSKIEERQKGVEDIMHRLFEISDTLRNYHQLGTPKLGFPRQHPHPPPAQKSPCTPSTSNLGRATTVAGSSPSHNIGLNEAKQPSPPTGNQRNKPRAPSLVRSNTATGELSPRSLMKDKARPRSPLINTFTTMDSSSEDKNTFEKSPKKNSDLPPEKLDNSSSNDIPFPISPPYEGGMKVPYLDMNKVEDQQTNEHDGMTHWFGDSPDSKNGGGKRERKITDSPIEMTFRSRF
ncbi:hypothetical protein L486_07306 [Kwoniella mangroviensis CBS 10435]|uniref:Uncharacterized protein n=1 Tax=Kwoniella mangroviensis CBS 10435 TaxID=1331196 RepID=A0A1B9II85_9TREE|nr:hypothetical protein L486_07306 [Kwoniella mangroviensis CBS 10435]